MTTLYTVARSDGDDRETIKTTMRDFQCDEAQAMQQLDWKRAERLDAQAKWLAGLPELKQRARAAYDAELEKGGANAKKRGVRAARRIWSSFDAP